MGHDAAYDTVRAARRRGRYGLVALIIAVVSLLAACGSSDSGAEPATTTKAAGSKSSTTTTRPSSEGPDLDGRQFTATDIAGFDQVPGSELIVTFSDGTLSVNGGCNTLSAAYEVHDGVLTWPGQPMSTQMACSDELMAQDAFLTNLFGAGVQAVLDGDTLTLTFEDVTITLDAVAAAPLAGTNWTLTGTIDDEAVSTLPAGAAPPTLTIDDGGTAKVFTGCNTGSTTFEVGDDTLTVAPMALTRMACEMEATFLENQVTRVLDGAPTYAIEGNQLTITNGDAGLVYEAKV